MKNNRNAEKERREGKKGKAHHLRNPNELNVLLERKY